MLRILTIFSLIKMTGVIKVGFKLSNISNLQPINKLIYQLDHLQVYHEFLIHHKQHKLWNLQKVYSILRFCNQ